MTILAISPFLWTMKRDSGVPTVSRTLQGFAQRSDVHLVLPSTRTAAVRSGNLTLHLFRLLGWARFLAFGPDRSIFSYPFPGGRLGRYFLDKVLWVQFTIQATIHAARISLKLKPAVFYGVTPYGAPAALLLRLLFGGVNVTRLLGTFLAPCTAYDSTFTGKCRRLLWLLPHFSEVLSFYLPAHAIVITDDGTQGDQVAARLGVTNVHCWRNGVDVPPGEALASRERHRQRLVEALRLPPDAVLGLYAGQLVAWKRVDRLLAACKTLATSTPYAILIVGDGPERRSLENIAREYGIEERVRFCGALSQSDLSHYRLGSDFFVCPHDLTCACNSLFEAMAAGLPVVATSFGDTAAVLTDRREGLLAAGPEPESLGLALATMIADRPFRRQAGRQARSRILRDLGGWDRRVEKEWNLLERLANAARA